MHIVIVGAGVVGVALAEQLSEEGHQVAVVDQARQKIREISDKLDVLAVHGNAGMPSVLKRAGIEQADMVIAVTDVDEVNLVVGMMAKSFGVARRIVRIRNREYVDDSRALALDELGVDQIINPDPAIVDALVRMIEIPGSTDLATLAGGEILMLGFDVEEDSPAAGVKLAKLRELGDLNAFLIIYISRGDEVIVPKGHDHIAPGDNVHVLVSADTVPFLLPVFYRHPKPSREVIIAGASRVGLDLARALESKTERVVLIEPDEDLAQEAAAHLEKTVVLHGEATSLDLLEEAAIERCDLFCALSDDDQKNMLAALLAKRHGAHKAAVLVHQPEFVPVLDSLGVEIVISPRLVTVGQILMHVRRGAVHSVTRFAESRAELIEMDAPEGSPAVKAPLRELHFPEHALVGAVLRDGIMTLPTGETQIRPGETVVVFALPDAIGRIEKLFTRKRWI